MSRRLVPDHRQRDKIASLIDDLGVNTYRNAKAAVGLGRMAPFQRFSYADALRLIGMLESLQKERIGRQGEHVFDACSQQTRPQQPRQIGLPEPTPAEVRR